MKKIHTHYDNLKISPNATDKQIRTAYLRLSKKYHPDYNKHPDAVRVMQLINRAYQVLSDPDKRREHDRWIALQKNSESMSQIPVVYGAIPEANAFEGNIFSLHKNKLYLAGIVLVAILALGSLIFWIIGRVSLPENKDNTLYTVYETAPNGVDWPISAGNIPGYPVLNQNGDFKLVVRNLNQKSAAFIQLYDMMQIGQGALQTAFLPASSNFSFSSLSAGKYHIRYMCLDNGQWQQSQILDINQDQSISLQLDNLPESEFISVDDIAR